MSDNYHMATREEELYHESARELASRVVQLEEAVRLLLEENRVLKGYIALLAEKPVGGVV